MPNDAIKELKAVETLLRCGNVNPVQIAARIKSLLPALEQREEIVKKAVGALVEISYNATVVVNDLRAALNPPTTPAPDALAHSCFVRAALNPTEPQ